MSTVPWRSALVGLAAGAAATYAKGIAEGQLQPLAETLLPPTPAQKIEIGADPAGHPENMPPSEVADRAVHAVTGRELTDEQRQKVSVPIHWATGLGSGALYGVLACRYSKAATGRGALAGVVLFASTHGSLLPLTGFQDPPAKLPKAWWIWEGGSHVVYGMVLDAGRRLIDRVAGDDC